MEEVDGDFVIVGKLNLGDVLGHVIGLVLGLGGRDVLLLEEMLSGLLVPLGLLDEDVDIVRY